MFNMDLIGLTTKDPEWYQIMVRTIVVFIVALAFIRISGMRTFGTQSAFDVVVSITLGALLSRAITGHYPFFNCLGSACLLVVLHRITSHLSSKSKLIKKIAEGEPKTLFENGQLVKANLIKYGITEEDIVRALHEQNINVLKKVESIILETDGTISVVKK
jgi:uncharacterized membrane protein YcaP (DUF421 family)